MKFLDIKTDFAFKKVFGSQDSQPRLISFLNAIIYSEDDTQITDLEIVDPYNIPMLKGMKDSFVDVKANLNNGTQVIIEMQVLPHEGFEKRVLYNAAKNYSVQLVKGEQYHLLNPIIALNIVDFNMFPETEKVITKFKLLEKEDFIDYSDDLELIFVELPKFKTALENLSNIKEEWIWFVKNAESLDIIPQSFSGDVKSALETANEAGMSAAELELQYKKKEFISVQKSTLTLAKKQGMTIGLEKGMEAGLEKGMKAGLEKGRKEEKIALVVSSLKQGLSFDIIANITGLSVEEIKEIGV